MKWELDIPPTKGRITGLHDDVVCVLDTRDRAFFNGYFEGAVEDDGAHCFFGHFLSFPMMNSANKPG